MLRGNIALLGAAFSLMLGPVLCESELTRTIQLVEDAVEKALTRIQDDGIWRDASRQEELRDSLRLLGKLRVGLAAKVLAPHIDYSTDREDEEYRRPTVEERFPVSGVLKTIGLPAVPHLVSVLRESDPGAADLRQKRILAIYCLIGIFGQAGPGPQLARLTLELEAEAVPESQRESVRDALEHPLLKSVTYHRSQSQRE